MWMKKSTKEPGRHIWWKKAFNWDWNFYLRDYSASHTTMIFYLYKQNVNSLKIEKKKIFRVEFRKKKEKFILNSFINKFAFRLKKIFFPCWFFHLVTFSSFASHDTVFAHMLRKFCVSFYFLMKKYEGIFFLFE
jgi:hypothetical protein